MVGVDGVCFQDPSKAEAVAKMWETEVRKARDSKFIVSLPEILRRFVRDFDLGAYPRLLTEEDGAAGSQNTGAPGFTPSLVRAEKPAA